MMYRRFRHRWDRMTPFVRAWIAFCSTGTFALLLERVVSHGSPW